MRRVEDEGTLNPAEKAAIELQLKEHQRVAQESRNHYVELPVRLAIRLHLG